MKLVKTETVEYFEIIAEAKLISQLPNKPLAKMLRKIDEEGISQFLNDPVLRNFSQGLLSNFEQLKYVSASTKKLLQEGKKVVDSEKEWKNLYGDFKFGIVRKDHNYYIVNCEPQYELKNVYNKTMQQLDLSFLGEYENSKGMHIKDIQLNLTIFAGNTENKDIECLYDYKTNKNSYAIEIDGQRIEFPENPSTFKLVDSSDAQYILQNALINYQGFQYQDSKVLLTMNAQSNILFNNAIEDVFSNGLFTIPLPDTKDKITDVRISIESPNLANELLYRYLLSISKDKYCGYSEMATLITDFYNKFEDCADISDNTITIYTKLKEKAFNENKTAYLRLMAYEDLMPDSIEESYQVGGVKDFSNQRKTLESLVKDIIGSGSIKKVTMLTKYAYKNAKISRAINLFANALKRNYNIPLFLITCKNDDYEQADVAKRYFNELKYNDNIRMELKEFKDICKIHDRYYKVELESGEIRWIKMTGELDAFRYENDFVDGKTPNEHIDYTTEAHVKEMSIISIDQKGIIPTVAKIMEG